LIVAPIGGHEIEDVGEQALMRGLSTA